MYGSSNLETWTGVDVVHACRLSRCKSCVANAGQAEKAAGENLRVLDERVKNLTSKALMFQFPVKEGRSARSCRFLRISACKPRRRWTEEEGLQQTALSQLFARMLSPTILQS